MKGEEKQHSNYDGDRGNNLNYQLRLPVVCLADEAAAGTINNTQHSKDRSGDRQLPASLKVVFSGECLIPAIT